MARQNVIVSLAGGLRIVLYGADRKRVLETIDAAEGFVGLYDGDDWIHVAKPHVLAVSVERPHDAA